MDIYRIRKLLSYFGIACGSILVAFIVFLVVAWQFRLNVLGLALTSATKVVGVFGDKLPMIDTPYGKIQIRSKRTAQGSRVEIGCAECRLENKLLADRPFLTTAAVLDGQLKQNNFSGTATVEEIQVNLTADWSTESISGSFELPETELRKVFYAVRTIVPEGEKAKISGTVSGRGKFSWPEMYLLMKPDIRNFAVSGLVEEKAYLHGKFQYKGKDNSGKEISIESGEGSDRWMPMSQVTPWLAAAIVAVEDRGFYGHHGYDISSIVEATAFNKKSGHVKRGGSTLTQQLAKNLFLSDEKTYARKLRELLYAVEIDRELGKKRIMELYLNVVEWGPNIYGVKAAAQIYFHKAPADLAPEEAAWLATILRSPKRAYIRQFEKDSPNTNLVGLVLRRMSGLSETERNAALDRQIHFTH